MIPLDKIILEHYFGFLVKIIPTSKEIYTA
jgi:hypothetical protein